MAYNFSKNWAAEIAEVTDRTEYQTCEITVEDQSNLVTSFDYVRGETTYSGGIELYSGRARYIPFRAGVWQGGESQANATTIRTVRFQIPSSELGLRVKAGSIVTITAAPFNPNLVGRTAKVNEDFQGSSAASRTIHATMDSDSEDDDG